MEDVLKVVAPTILASISGFAAWWWRGRRTLDEKRLDSIRNLRDRSESEEERAAWDALLERERLAQLAAQANLLSMGGWRQVVRTAGVVYGALFSALAVAIALTQGEEGRGLYVVFLALATVCVIAALVVVTPRAQLRRHRHDRQEFLDKKVMDYAAERPDRSLPKERSTSEKT